MSGGVESPGATLGGETIDLATLDSRALGEAAPKARVFATIVAHRHADRLGEYCEVVGTWSVSRQTPLFVGAPQERARPLADPYLSRSPLVTIRRHGAAWRFNAGKSSTHFGLGTSSPAELDVDAEALERGVLVCFGKHAAIFVQRRSTAPSESHAPATRELIGRSEPMVELRRRVETAAPQLDSMLIRGETGTGKELIARAFHLAGPQPDAPFLPCNVGSLTPSTLASELFGHLRGAFTGADRDRAGLFREAGDGTVFLDEIGEAPPEVQRSLLRVLEAREVTPVGSSRILPVRARVVAATDAALEREVEQDSFRAPLLYRLERYTVHVPPLRERPGDIPLLFAAFASRFAERAGRSLGDGSVPWMTPAHVRHLLQRAWPGNVRELRNVAESAVVDTRGDGPLELPSANEAGSARPWSASLPRLRRSAPRGDAQAISKAQLLEALEEAEFRVKPAAKRLGVGRTSVYELMARHGIPRSSQLEEGAIQAALHACEGDVSAAAKRLRVSRRGLLLQMKTLGLRR